MVGYGAGLFQRLVLRFFLVSYFLRKTSSTPILMNQRGNALVAIYAGNGH